jgi:hypothetical protein
VRYGDFTTLTRAFTAPGPLAPGVDGTAGQARAVVAALLDPLLDGRPVRLVGVRLSGFQEATGQQRLWRFGLGGPAPSIVRRFAPRDRPPVGGFDPGGLRWSSLAAWGSSAA